MSSQRADPLPAATERFHVAILAFPGVTQLDFTGPMEVLHRVPGLRIDLAWKSLEPVEWMNQPRPR